MFTILARVVGFVITAASGWAVSDIFQEHQTAKQLDSAATIAGSTKEAYKNNKTKWLWLAIGAVAAFFVITYVIKPLFMRGNQKESIL